MRRIIKLENYDSNILNEIIEDFIENENLYDYCLNKLLINYYGKAESGYFFTNKKKKKEEEKPNEDLESLDKSIKYIKISKKLYERIKDKSITSYKKPIEDFELKIDVKKLLIQLNMGIKVSNNKIEELYLKYQKCYDIESEDYQELSKYIEKKKKKIN